MIDYFHVDVVLTLGGAYELLLHSCSCRFLLRRKTRPPTTFLSSLRLPGISISTSAEGLLQKLRLMGHATAGINLDGLQLVADPRVEVTHRHFIQEGRWREDADPKEASLHSLGHDVRASKPTFTVEVGVGLRSI